MSRIFQNYVSVNHQHVQTSPINRLRSSGSDNWHIQTTRESSNANYIEVLLQSSRQNDLHYHVPFVATNRGSGQKSGQRVGFSPSCLAPAPRIPHEPLRNALQKQPPVAKVLSSLRFSRNSLAKHAPCLAGCSRVSCHGSKHLPFNPHSDSRPRPSELRIAKRTICDLKARRSL